MKALIQRVSFAKVEVEDKTISSINDGLLIFVGIYFNDTIDDINNIIILEGLLNQDIFVEI